MKRHITNQLIRFDGGIIKVFDRNYKYIILFTIYYNTTFYNLKP